jgi:DNA-binding NarL/FixJ family response regulator
VKITFSIVDDDADVRNSISGFVQENPNFCCVGSYAMAKKALELIPKSPPDVVLMDINMPVVDGIECTRLLKASNPSLHILMLTVYEDPDLIFKALKAGASGYLLKRVSPEKLFDAIQEVYLGGSPMSMPIARKVVKYFQQMGNEEKEVESLSTREREVLQLLAEGRAYKQISAHLDISLDTTRTYIRRIYEKLHVHSRTEAVMQYLNKTRER